MTDFVDARVLITMDPEIKAKWVADLRSGNIKQARGVLVREDTGAMCCLGVLTVQAANQGAVSWIDTYDIEFGGENFPCRVYGNGEDVSKGTLTRTVSEWAGIKPGGLGISGSGILPFRTPGGTRVFLDALNDSGMPFNQIADLIEYWY
jgi:hypothetical protein